MLVACSGVTGFTEVEVTVVVVVHVEAIVNDTRGNGVLENTLCKYSAANIICFAVGNAFPPSGPGTLPSPSEPLQHRTLLQMGYFSMVGISPYESIMTFTGGFRRNTCR